MGFELTSPAFRDGEEIPRIHTGYGKDISPPLAWTGVPEGTRSLALIVDDPDAPDPARPRMTWVHWLLYNLPPELGGLPAGVAERDLPLSAGLGLNDLNRTGYCGPSPPVGRHRYVHKLYALDVRLSLGTPRKSELEVAMQNHILDLAVLIGTCRKRFEMAWLGGGLWLP